MTWVVLKVVRVEEEVVEEEEEEEEVEEVEEVEMFRVKVGRFVVKGNSSQRQMEDRRVERTDPSRLQSGTLDLKAPQ